MSRLIDADVFKTWVDEYLSVFKKYEKHEVKDFVEHQPSIDLVRCGECKWEWTQKCPPHRMGLIHDESDYCSYGIRKTDGVDKHDEAVEALGHLIKRMKGADDE